MTRPHVRRPGALLATLLLAASTATACHRAPDDRAVKKPDWPYRVHVGDRYVALGDSYTAAPRTGPKVSDDGCYNTRTNYPHQIARATEAILADGSCNGASTRSLKHPQELALGREHAPQLDLLTPDTALVTLRIGANDFSLYAHIIQCALLVRTDPDGSPCTDYDEEQGAKSVERLLPKVEGRLREALAAIEEQAPDAEVFVIGYPRVAPEHGTCDAFPLPAGDYAYARRIIEGLNQDLESAARTAGVPFIDMYAASKGHDVCSKDPWVAGYPRPWGGGAAAWHPFKAESDAVAELVLAELRS